jgi:hypothetical protein
MELNARSVAESFDPAVANRPVSMSDPYSDQYVISTDAFGPLFYADDVRVTEAVDPGGVVDVEVELVNEDTIITPLHPDACTAGVYNGLGAEVTIDPDWTDSVTLTPCLRAGGFTPTRQVLTADFEAPDIGGSHNVSVTVEGQQSGNGGTETFQVAVESGSGIRPGVPDDPSPGDGGGIGIPDVGTGTSAAVIATTLLVAIILILILTA